MRKSAVFLALVFCVVLVLPSYGKTHEFKYDSSMSAARNEVAKYAYEILNYEWTTNKLSCAIWVRIAAVTAYLQAQRQGQFTVCLTTTTAAASRRTRILVFHRRNSEETATTCNTVLCAQVL